MGSADSMETFAVSLAVGPICILLFTNTPDKSFCPLKFVFFAIDASSSISLSISFWIMRLVDFVCPSEAA